MFHRARHPSALALSVCLTLPSGLHAQHGASETRDLIRRGFEARAAQHDREALDAFERAYAIDPVPSTLAQQALAEHALGRWVEAETHLMQSLAHTEDAWITSQRASLVEALRVVQEHLGTLAMDGPPAGASVFLDGDPVGTLPLAVPLRVPEGTVLLRVSLDGHYTVERRVTIRSGRTSMESVTLHPIIPPVAGPMTVRSPSVTLHPPPSPVPWVFAGAGAAVFGSSVALWVLRGERESAVRSLCAQTDNQATHDLIECIYTPAVVEAYGSLESMNAGMNVVVGIGALATAVSVTWGVVDLALRARERRGSVTPSAVSMSLSHDAHSATVLIHGSF